jgi:hypothetical protein
MKRSLLTPIAVTAASVLAAGVSWLNALAVFIPVMKTNVAILRVTVWLSSPVIVSLGFAFGYWLADRWLRVSHDRFVSLWLWPLIACSIGAAAVFPFGPMLIVFGAFAGGTASVILPESHKHFAASPADDVNHPAFTAPLAP